MFYNADLVADTVTQTLIVCFYKLIPSIFPFMILSGIIMKSINSLLFRDQSKIKVSALIIIISWISGFLVGPRHICKYENERDVTYIVFLTSNAGIGFVIFYVGVALWDSIYLGTFLYFVQICSSVLLFVLYRKSKEKMYVSSQSYTFVSSVNESIQESTQAMLDICGFAIFFSIIKNLLVSFINLDLISLIISSSLEISSGTFFSINSENTALCAFFTGFSVGMGGICMCMQTFGVCRNANIRKGKFLYLKLLQGLICGFAMVVFSNFTKAEPVRQVYLKSGDEFSIFVIVISALFLCSAISYLKKSLKNKLYSH